MKIVCDSCAAKYSIADEKVQGKVFKIRCKKCSNVIVVKGSAEAEAADDSGGAAEWYVVIDGEQVGPVTTVEIDSYFMSGQINAETYAWKDGMGDWRHIVDIPEFAHLGQDTAGPNEATQIAESPRYDNDVDSTNVVNSPLAMGGEVLDTTIGGDSGYNDPYPSDPGYGDDDYGYGGDDGGYSGFAGGYDSGGMGGELAAAGGDDGGGMFAAFDSGGDSDFMSFGSSNEPAAVEAPSSSIGEGLVGQRNENSVLFSLSSLDSVGAVGGGGSAKDDVPVTEGSGLIDIQALATAHKSMSSSGADEGGIDPFAQGTMAMPALMPMGSHRNNNSLYIAIGVAAFALLGMGGLGIYLLTKDDPEPATIIKEVHTVEKVVEAPVDKDKAAAEADEAEKAAKQAAEADPKKVEEPEEPEEDKKTASASKSSSSKKTSTKSDPDPAPEPKKDPPKKKDGIDSILDKIDDKAEAVAKKEDSGGADKKSLSRTDVKQTINRYNSRVNTCAKSQNSSKKTGTVKVKFYIRPNGRVRGEEVVSPDFKGTDVGNCVEKVVGSMTFPKTSASKDVPVTYPFIIK